ncbi:TIGR04282 family arsenosugar biosynthesis glycosyltransferase [Confluentibacter flavum]|uniref:Glycosyltransferase n=1 Tax=Confluentibacter flavum TaxID=1909700 RepID=A0A2N3HG24_9FLAO|nr:TIGR04282 family arsenosugar biosynthesis glycosyltransferase [Confluentibacter flavum]PKQ43863.1 glycosyltransferase [Confluentibacter flavum]
MSILINNDNTDNPDMVDDFHFPTSKNALIIFIRNPELGKCKTRLAETIGNEAALKIYKQLLLHTSDVTKSITADRFVFYSEAIQKNDIWEDAIFRKKLQSEGDLGVKMETAFLELFQMGYEKAIIIGSDLFDLKPLHINSAYQALNTHEVVIGPAKDGGYYLLGLSKMNESLFKNKPWSTSNLLEETLNELRENNIKFTTLETLNDIDTYEDLIA